MWFALSPLFNKNLRWVWFWIIVIAIPFTPIFWPLLLHLFADSPDADLAFVPVLALAWMARNLQRHFRTYQDDVELNYILGSCVCLLVVAAMIILPRYLPLAFWTKGIALLLWPLWAMAVTWMVFGVGVTTSVLAPSLYLSLASPIVFSSWMTPVQNILMHVDERFLLFVSRITPWMVPESGGWSVEHGGQMIPVVVSTACVGSDSITALFVVLPFLFSMYRSTATRRLAVLIVGVVLAVVLNIVRVTALLVTMHLVGSGAIFDSIHETLGSALFVLLAAVLLWFMRFSGMRLPMSIGETILHQPSRARASWLGAITLLAMGVVYSAVWHDTTRQWRPIVVRVNPTDGTMPNVPGYQKVLLGAYNDSSVLGTGAHSVAYAYSNRDSLYERVEVWNVQSPWHLEAFGAEQCLTFHGDKVLDAQKIKVADNLWGTRYVIELPSLTVDGSVELYQVIAATFEADTRGQDGYYRIEISTPVLRGINPTTSKDQVLSLINTAWNDDEAGKRVEPQVTPVSNVSPDLQVSQEIVDTKRFAEEFTRQVL